MSNLVESVRVGLTALELTFKQTLQLTSIHSDRFTLLTQAATPTTVTTFKMIQTNMHYNTVSRTLTIYFETLPDTGIYDLRISGLRTAAGEAIPTEIIEISYTSDSTPITDDPPYQEPTLPLDIEDHSIKANVFTSTETIVASNPSFHIVRTNPENAEIFVEEDHMNGRISITFSVRPSLLYINENYIKVQRKKLGTPLSRWERLEAKFALDSTLPKLYINIPSIGATPVYSTDDQIYFEPGYKYRVRMSGDIAAQQ